MSIQLFISPFPFLSFHSIPFHFFSFLFFPFLSFLSLRSPYLILPLKRAFRLNWHSFVCVNDEIISKLASSASEFYDVMDTSSDSTPPTSSSSLCFLFSTFFIDSHFFLHSFLAFSQELQDQAKAFQEGQPEQAHPPVDPFPY